MRPAETPAASKAAEDSQNESVLEQADETTEPHLSQTGPAEHRGKISPGFKQLAPRKPTKLANVSPADIEAAKKLLDKGLLAYQKGDYDAAEAALAQSMALYPFLAEAHLTLGKIYLMRGSANRDPTMIDHARLMFQMAHAVDPNLRETDLLLQLFLTEPLP